MLIIDNWEIWDVVETMWYFNNTIILETYRLFESALFRYFSHYDYRKIRRWSRNVQCRIKTRRFWRLSSGMDAQKQIRWYFRDAQRWITTRHIVRLSSGLDARPGGKFLPNESMLSTLQLLLSHTEMLLRFIQLRAVFPTDPQLLARILTVNGRNLCKKIIFLFSFCVFFTFYLKNFGILINFFKYFIV